MRNLSVSLRAFLLASLPAFVLAFVVAMSLVSLTACGDDGGGDAADAAMCTPGQTALYATCTINSDCDTCICHSYNMSGLLCSMSCMGDGDCPAPSPGCNMMGICKRPQ
jgi:hypothetical protein